MTSDENFVPVKVRLSDNIAKRFIPVHKAIKTGLIDGRAVSSFWLKGGRGSTKSSFAAIEIILGIINDPEANAIVFRKVGDTVRQSVMATLLWAIAKLELAEDFDSIKSPAEITYLPTGQKIIMKGLDDPVKMKSVKIEQGYFKYLWFEEASEYTNAEEIRNVQQSVLRGGERFVEFLTYNPPNNPAAWVNVECDTEVSDRLVHDSTYLDVPPEWLGPKFLSIAETLKEADRVKYDHEYMGLAVGRAEQIIFSGKWMEKEFVAPAGSRFFMGSDWGFANDPTTLVRSFEKKDWLHPGNCLYVDHAAFGYGVELDDLPAFFDSVPESRRWPIKADCSRPETISFVRRSGFTIDGAEKWEGCVEDGIEHLKGFKKIIIHPRCKHLIREFSLYSYKVDRVTQDVLPIIVKKHDHGIDGIRYGLDGYIQKRGGLGVWAKLAR